MSTKSHSSSKSHKTRDAFLLVLIAIILFFFFAFPFPYRILEKKEKLLVSYNDETLSAGYTYTLPEYLFVGDDIEFSVSANVTVALFVFTGTQYANFNNTGSYTSNEKQLLDVINGKLGYHASSAGTYYFVVYNRITGFLGINAKCVDLYSVSVKVYWQEEITKYITLWEMLTGAQPHQL